MALFLFTPGMPVAVNSLATLMPADDSKFQHEVPTQSDTLFTSQPVGTYDLADWKNPTDPYLDSQQVTQSNNSEFNNKHADYTLTNLPANREPHVIATNTPNMPAKGAYIISSAITLSANAYYMVEVDYCVVEMPQDKNQTRTSAFGTFYVNNHAITLLPKKQSWNRATFYIQTDKLETATITPELYFGSRNQDAIGSIYFDKFSVTAVNQGKFDAEIENLNNPLNFIDFTNEDAYQLAAEEFENTDFTPSYTTGTAESSNQIATSKLPKKLGFQDDKRTVFHKDGMTGDVMLIMAYQSNASLTLEKYTFQPRPHEVYMFQFYSLATSATDFNGFYFMIGNTAEQITNLDDYPYHNGWQLNTIFFEAGHDLYQEYELSFTLTTNSTAATGWACIDEFRIYKVNGSYAANNASALGVHDFYNQNSDSTTDSDGNTITASVANGYFELGTAADTVTTKGSSYPYPLVADEWETNVNTNGIVNLHATLWDSRFGEHPGAIDGNRYDSNNHVYMMHNSSRAINLVTSPSLTTTIGSTTYVSFDAYGKNTSAVRAYIFTADTDSDGNTTNEIVLGDIIQINDNSWHHYEFAIIDGAYATAHTYYLRFEMTGIGYAYIDNVRTTTDGPYQFSSAEQTTSTVVDLTNPLTIGGLWKATDEFTSFYCDVAKNGITFGNIDQQKTVIKNTFSYNLVADDYYEFVIEAHGKNAYLGFSNYDGLLEVTKDTRNPDTIFAYKLYLQPSSDATSVNLQITLGYVAADDEDDDDAVKLADGEIFISSINVTSITEDEFNDVKNNADDNDRIKILSLSEEDDSNSDTADDDTNNNFWDALNENWWYLVPTLITAIALLLAIGTFLFRKVKFEKHITKKTTSYARDMQLKNQRNKIVAQKAAKVDNVIDETQK